MFHLYHSVITHIHCPILIYQQFRSWYWNPPGQFLCQWWFSKAFKALGQWLFTWMNTNRPKRKKISEWSNIYTVIIACHRWKFRNQNWKYGHWNNYFGLHANFHGLFFHTFLGTIPIFRVFQGPFQGYKPFWGFQGLLTTLLLVL